MTLHMHDVDLFSPSELKEKLKSTLEICSTLENSKKELETLVENLETSLKEQVERCKALEDDRTFLRKNIRQASANWFEKKARLSDSENETPCDGSHERAGERDQREAMKDPCVMSKDETIQLFADLKFKSDQIELSEKRCSELSKRLKDYEQVIDDQEIIIHGMKEQLDTYFDDNQKMSRQLNEFTRIFQELELINEKESNQQSRPAEAQVNEVENSEESQQQQHQQEQQEQQEAEVSVQSSSDHQTKEDFKIISGSVSKTYLKLKELIYEKKSLVTEIERLRTLNIELQHRVSQQENRLMSVSDALQATWLSVSNLKDEHEKIHTNESILRYQLREKREILQKLREELECSREQWHSIRQKNTETEQEWTTLRRELNERRRAETMKKMVQAHEEIAEASGCAELLDNEFEPPIDLLLDMGIESGVVDADDEESTTCVALMGGEDVHAERLQNLEDQCCQLYQKLMTSTSRALALASRLTTLHEQYAISDDDDDDNEDYLEGDLDFDDDMDVLQSIVSPDAESNDTAYLSEPEIVDPNSTNEASTLLSSGDSAEASYPDTGIEEEASPYDSSPENCEEACDLLSKRLINFLPKKIELLRADNKKLEEKLLIVQEEKLKIEAIMTASIEFERRQRKQLEEQLSHLGKCVDELHLERNGKITKMEDDLRKKIEEVELQETKHQCVEEELETLKNKYEERGELLRLTALQLQQSESRAQVAEEALNKFKLELDDLHREISNFKIKDKEDKEK